MRTIFVNIYLMNRYTIKVQLAIVMIFKDNYV